jgi:DNA repair exonuclease SbcCD ATPase subunit
MDEQFDVSEIALDPRALDAALDAATEAHIAGWDDQQQLVEAIKTYLLVAGKAEDYRKLRAELTFTIRDATFVSTRNGTTAKLLKNGEEVAVGMRPVNEKVVKELGYGLEVFDTSNIANQGDLEKLGSMRPAERKRMVDSVIGLGAIDDLGRWCGDEALTLQRAAEAIERTLQEPTAPIRPDGYVPSVDLQVKVGELTTHQDDLNRLNGWLSHVRDEPVAPTCDEELHAEDLKVLVGAQQDRQVRLRTAKAQLAKIPTAPTLDMLELERMETQHVKWDRWQAKQAFLRLHPPVTMTADEIAKAKATYDLFRVYRSLDLLEKEREGLLAHGEHCCPACDHHWPRQADGLKAVDLRISTLRDHIAGRERPVEPNMDAVAQAERRLADWTAHHDEWEKLKDVEEVEKPALSMLEIERAHAAIALQAQRPRLEAEIQELTTDEPDYSGRLRRRMAYDDALARYEQDVATYQAWLDEWMQKRAEADRLTGLVDGLPALRSQLEQARLYEAQQATFERMLEHFLKASVEAQGLRTQSDDWKNAKAAMLILRGLVKQHLVPSLNRVASHLLKLMTGGQRQTVEVDEDFDITVDGQALSTLSGSGKAVVNLALRLGLGQVLTNNVFSLFIGDEIDASMDKDRAKNTAQVLEMLKERISQILLVTHKFPSADYYIELGKFSEPDAGTAYR